MSRYHFVRHRLSPRTLFLAPVVAAILAFSCSTATSVGDAAQNAPSSVEQIKTQADAAVFLEHVAHAIGWVTSQRDFQASPAAQFAHRQAESTLQWAIECLNGTTAIEPSPTLPPEWQQADKSLLGVWRHRLNADQTENLMVFGPGQIFVAARGPQVWAGNWERRGDLLYTQNVRGSAEHYNYLGLPDIQRITTAEDGSITLSSTSQDDSPGFTLTRIP